MHRVQTVVVERSFERTMVFDELQRAEEAAAWCLEQHDVRFRRSYLSLDGRSMVCLYDAPDAESVRMTQRTGGLPFARAWACTELVPPDGATAAPPGFSTVVVERELSEGMSLESVQALVAMREPCFDAHKIELLTSHVSADVRRTICIFSAPDAEAVRRANAHAGQRFTRAWTASVHEP